MKLQLKKLALGCMLLSVSVCLLQLFVVSLYKARYERYGNLKWRVDLKCVDDRADQSLSEELSKALSMGKKDVFMITVAKYLPDCKVQVDSPNLSKQQATNRANISTINRKKAKRKSTKRLCPKISPFLRGPVHINITETPMLINVNGRYKNWPLTFEELAIKYKDLQLGGYYTGPRYCKCRSHNAIIVPYRDREEHLRYFLYYMHQLLQRQQICYIIIVSEQDDNRTFNKGQLMNTAFRYARELMPFNCYVFHDVDLLAEDDRLLYTCRNDSIMHYAPYIDKYDYKFVKGLTVGAAVGFTEDLFLAVNGFSNEYAGWGGEDDDMSERIAFKQIPLWRLNASYSRFTMIKHGTDPGNSMNEHRWQRLKFVRKRQAFDGVNFLDTTLTDNIHYKTHTRLKVLTYKTGLQTELERFPVKKEEGSKISETNAANENAMRIGIPIPEPGKVLKVEKKT